MFGVEKSSVVAVLGSVMRLLTVLDLPATPLTRFPAQVAEWCYLRYLSFRYSKVRTVPYSIGNLQNLETLDLKQTYVTELPVVILKLQRLRHLLVYRYANIGYPWCKSGFKSPEGIGALQSLQKLCFMEAGDRRNNSLMRELGKLKELIRLGITKLRKEDGRELCSSIENLTKLQAISLTSINKNEIIDLQELSSPPPFLQRICLTGRLEALPHWISSVDSLTALHLRWSQLQDSPLLSLGNLPNLVCLELLQVYEGTKLSFKANDFMKLQCLVLGPFDKLKCVEVEKGSLPCLEELVIEGCKPLEKLPSGIEHLGKLKVLKFFDMPDEFVKKLLSSIEHLGKLKVLKFVDMPNEFVKKLMPDGQEDYYLKVAHVPEVYYGYRRDGGCDFVPTKAFV